MRTFPYKLLAGFFILFTALCLNAHTYKVPMVVDTDMGLDDLRALVLLLNSDMADIRLIVTSDGSLSPETGHENLKRLLVHYKQKNIPTAAGRELDKPAPPWRGWTKSVLSFLPEAPPPPGKTAVAAIVNVLKATESPFIYLCLGPLTNLADAYGSDPGIKNHISRVIYYGSTASGTETDWNTTRDAASTQAVADSGMKCVFFGAADVKPLPFDHTFFKKIEAMDTPVSRLFIKLHQLPTPRKLLESGHFRIWDEMTIIYLNRPDLFEFTRKGRAVSVLRGFNRPGIYNDYLKLVGYTADSHLLEREVVVLNSFPTRAELFKEDLRPMVGKILQKYGMEEWKATVLTNELHRHLGIYSIVGAKMGIYAREKLTAPLDSLKVVSMAGNRPPVSCLNDGLQVSTGASLGRGTIEIDDSSPRAAATFIYNDRKLTLKLKEEIIRQIKKDIQAAIKKYGPLTPEYFSHVRELSIKYWYNMNRSEIFEED